MTASQIFGLVILVVIVGGVFLGLFIGLAEEAGWKIALGILGLTLLGIVLCFLGASLLTQSSPF